MEVDVLEDANKFLENIEKNEYRHYMQTHIEGIKDILQGPKGEEQKITLDREARLADVVLQAIENFHVDEQSSWAHLW